jgi:hypothetical protein
MLQPNRGPYNNPPAFFTQNPEIEDPAQSVSIFCALLL